MPKVVMVCGYPASGKSSKSEEYIQQGYIHLNRDKQGGKVIDLVPKMQIELSKGKNVVLDNLFPTRESRQPFIKTAKQAGADIHCVVMGTTIEDAQINALQRMYRRYGKLFLGKDNYREVKDSNVFPVSVLFGYRKDSEGQDPHVSEGFASVEYIKFKRNPLPKEYCNKALILDYDDTLRRSTGPEPYPTHPDHVEILPGRIEKLKEYESKGYLLLGVSNQSGIAKGLVSEENAIAAFKRTNELLGCDIDFNYCPHSVPPSCYCRKPQSGLGVYLIEKHKLDPNSCIYVGDATTDKTFAKRLGFKYFTPEEFFDE